MRNFKTLVLTSCAGGATRSPPGLTLPERRLPLQTCLALCRLSSRLIREAEEKLASWIHPDPWVNPYMPGGSRFMRNPAMPLSIVFPPDLFPEGVPPEYNIASQVRAQGEPEWSGMGQSWGLARGLLLYGP